MDSNKNKEIMEIALEDIIPNRFQPRLTFDVDALNDLARSIKEHGIIQPLVVRRVQNKFEIIAGERRFKAAGMIGMKTVPCIIMDLSDGESAEVAIVENIQRKEMTPLEEAKSFKKLLEKGYLTQEDLAKKMGKSQSSIANKLRLLNLDDLVQDAILNNKISERHARSLLRVNDKMEQRNILNGIIQNRLTVKQTDDLINSKYGSNLSQTETLQYNEPKIETPPKLQNISLPEVKIPPYNNHEESNPQLKILNALGTDNNENSDYHNREEKKSVDLPDESTNPALNLFRYGENKVENMPQNYKKEENMEENINNQKLLNPSELDYNNRSKKEIPHEQPQNEVPEEKLLNLSNLESASDFYKGSNEIKAPNYQDESTNILNIKETAKDIVKEEQPKEDAPDLLVSESEERENKFLIGIKKEEVQKENNNLNFIDVEENEPRYKKAREKINKELEVMQTEGVKIYKEESDFGNTIQIIIRIEK